MTSARPWQEANSSPQNQSDRLDSNRFGLLLNKFLNQGGQNRNRSANRNDVGNNKYYIDEVKHYIIEIL